MKHDNERRPLDPGFPYQMTSRQRDSFNPSITAIIIGVVVAVFLYFIRDILLPFVLAGILAYICTPVVDWLTARTRWPRPLFAIAVLLMLMAFAALFTYLGVPVLLREVTRLSNDLQGSIETLIKQLIGDGTVQLLSQPINAAKIANYAADGLRSWLSQGHMFTIAAFGFAGVFAFILTWVLLGYFLIGGPALSDSLFWLIPPNHRPFAHRVWSDLHQVLWRYFVGVALVVLYASIVAYIGLGLILGIRHAVFLAILTGVLEIIPVAGPLASAVIAGLVAVREAAGAWNIIAYIVYAVALRISIDEFFGPIVLGRAAHVPPALVIFCFLAGGILFGVVGVIMAIPVALAIKAILYELYKAQGDQSQKDAPV